MYDLFRGLHILSVIAWMAGLLYLPRLFVYHIKNMQTGAVTEIFKEMERKLLRMIMTPAMIAAWAFGLCLIYLDVHDRWGWAFFAKPWVIVKLLGVVAMTVYHHVLATRVKRLERDEPIGAEKSWRMLNEVPFVLAVIIVLSATLEYAFK
ncbi:MAG: CopD family protein [Asticcacaulis sp.]